MEHKLWIDGKWQATKGGGPMSIEDPATGRKIAEVIRRLTELDFACIDGRLQSVPRPALKSY